MRKVEKLVDIELTETIFDEIDYVIDAELELRNRELERWWVIESLVKCGLAQLELTTMEPEHCLEKMQRDYAEARDYSSAKIRREASLKVAK